MPTGIGSLSEDSSADPRKKNVAKKKKRILSFLHYYMQDGLSIKSLHSSNPVVMPFLQNK